MRQVEEETKAGRFAPLAIVLGVLATGGLGGAPALADEAAASIRVTGLGRVQAAPDAATLDAGATNEARQAKTAIAANSQSMKALLAALRAQGIESKDIQTRQLQLTPVYPQGSGPRRAGIEGYRASSRLRIRVREIGEIGAVLDALVAAGANELGSISFAVLDPDPFLDRARAAAIADARRKAALFAREAGVRLGRIIEIRDGAAPIPFAIQFGIRVELRVEGLSGTIPLSPGVHISDQKHRSLQRRVFEQMMHLAVTPPVDKREVGRHKRERAQRC
jgi:uncharacterized protein YggE